MSNRFTALRSEIGGDNGFSVTVNYELHDEHAYPVRQRTFVEIFGVPVICDTDNELGLWVLAQILRYAELGQRTIAEALESAKDDSIAQPKGGSSDE